MKKESIKNKSITNYIGEKKKLQANKSPFSLKKWLWHRHFLENFAKVFRKPFLIEHHVYWLLLIFNAPC